MSVTPDCHDAGQNESSADNGKNVTRRQLVNRLNFINFQDETIIAHFRHTRYGSGVSLKLKPLPCAGEQLDCVWVETSGVSQFLKNYAFDHLLIPDGKKPLLARAKLVSSSEDGVSFHLPLSCREFKLRKIKRHPVSGIRAQFTQNSAVFHGALMDFTPVAMRVEGDEDAPQTFSWINPDIPVDLHLYDGDQLLYSGECGIIRFSIRQSTRSFVLSPLNSAIRRYRPKQYRSVRHHLVPSPNIVFKHPFIDSTVNLKVLDLSSSGMGVEEYESESVLMPGMVIPDLELTLTHGFRMACKAQVLSRNVIDEGDGEGTVRCGMTIIDMNIHDHVQLVSILHQAADMNSYLCTDVDMDALWDFFFETGFIYPEKYAFFQAEKQQIKKTYEKLYGSNPHIARHFIHLHRGTIQGHMAMVRFYEKSWLIHHHAARKSASLKAGLTVLSQVSHYINELHNHYFAHLDYVYCYFRPENKFPNRVFGGFARQLDNKRACSLDKFAYFHFHKTTVSPGAELTPPWELIDASSADFEELCNYYAYVSGGLMVDATDLMPERAKSRVLADEYARLGFKKEKHCFSLKKEGSLKAMALVNLTDAGFNMANLTNCVTLILFDEDIPRTIFDSVLENLLVQYYGQEMPVLLYPFSYVEKKSYQYEKTYMLWILDLNHSDDYFKYCDDLYKISRKTA